jgi:hypothetical protein
MRYDVNREGSLSNGIVLFHMTSTMGEDALGGLKVDEDGKTLYRQLELGSSDCG